MAVNLTNTIIIVIFCIILLGLALAYGWAFMPGFTLSGCWMSAQSQTQQLADWFLDGPIVRQQVERQITLGDCVDGMFFTNKPADVYCHSNMIGMDCPAGKKGYILTCRSKGLEGWFKGAYGICKGVSLPFSEAVTLTGPPKGGSSTYCLTFERVGGSYKIEKKVGACAEKA
jgi:hypothetical protein